VYFGATWHTELFRYRFPTTDPRPSTIDSRSSILDARFSFSVSILREGERERERERGENDYNAAAIRNPLAAAQEDAYSAWWLTRLNKSTSPDGSGRWKQRKKRWEPVGMRRNFRAEEGDRRCIRNRDFVEILGHA